MAGDIRPPFASETQSHAKAAVEQFAREIFLQSCSRGSCTKSISRNFALIPIELSERNIAVQDLKQGGTESPPIDGLSIFLAGENSRAMFLRAPTMPSIRPSVLTALWRFFCSGTLPCRSSPSIEVSALQRVEQLLGTRHEDRIVSRGSPIFPDRCGGCVLNVREQVILHTRNDRATGSFVLAQV